jgi:hypothetical protein
MSYTNPETGSQVDIEDDGDFTVTFSMSLPPTFESDGNGMRGATEDND